MIKGVALFIALAGVAAAAPVAYITAPADWKPDERQAGELLAKVSSLGHFGQNGGQSGALLEADVLVPPRPGIVLFTTRVTAQVTADRDRAARVEIDQLHRASQRAGLATSGITEDGWQERVDDEHKQIEASLTWRDRPNHTIDISRIVIAGDAEHLIAVTGECVARDDAELALIKACTEALGKLDPRVDDRVPLALAPSGTELPPPPDTKPRPQTSTMQDGSRAVMPPMTISHEAPPPDRRPVYVGGGVVVLAALFWWNRRRRERFERDDAPKESKESDDR